jgi:hypothetical protein
MLNKLCTGKPKKQTVLLELRQWVDTELKLLNYEHPIILSKIDELLEKEKHQTLLGVYEGQKNHSASDEENKIMAEHWYQQTFKQKK